MLEDKEPTTNAIAKRCNIIAVMKGKPSYLAYKMQPLMGLRHQDRRLGQSASSRPKCFAGRRASEPPTCLVIVLYRNKLGARRLDLKLRASRDAKTGFLASAIF